MSSENYNIIDELIPPGTPEREEYDRQLKITREELNGPPLIFSKRRLLESLFYKWRDNESPNASDSPFNVIGWLDKEGLINRHKAREILGGGKQ